MLRRTDSYRTPNGSLKHKYLVRCVCGSEAEVETQNLKRGQACYTCRNGKIAKARTTHGWTGTPEYKVWRGMQTRCYVPSDTSFERYGGRGIRVCSKWRNDFMAFLSDVGPRPSPLHSIDRIDPDGHYEPGNVRWVTAEVQANNKRKSKAK